jgi:hypothetical protein
MYLDKRIQLISVHPFLCKPVSSFGLNAKKTFFIKKYILGQTNTDMQKIATIDWEIFLDKLAENENSIEKFLHIHFEFYKYPNKNAA